MVGEVFPDDRRNTFTFDAVGKRTQTQDATGASSWSYTPRDEVQAATQPSGRSLTYTYDPVGRRASMENPDGGRYTYTHDAAGRLVQLANARNEITTFTLNAIGRCVHKELNNGASVTHTYDAADWLTRIKNTKSDGTLVNNFTYTYDKIGNRTTQQDVNGDRTTWTYDATYQLTREQRSGSHPFDISYDYDAVGNRVVMDEAGAQTTYTYDAANQLSSSQDIIGTTTFTHDADGNRTRKETPSTVTDYEWDEQNRMIASEPLSGNVSLTYNADGQRVKRESSTDTKHFLYDFRRLLQEADDSDNPLTEYTFTEDQYGELVSEYDFGDDESAYPTYDAQWSAETLLDEAETATDRYKYTAFGLESHVAGTSDQPFTFVAKQGYYHDRELDLYLLGMGGNSAQQPREYEAETGRLLSKDPVETEDTNDYSYVGNNPVNAIDPSGGEQLNEEGFNALIQGLSDKSAGDVMSALASQMLSMSPEQLRKAQEFFHAKSAQERAQFEQESTESLNSEANLHAALAAIHRRRLQALEERIAEEARLRQLHESRQRILEEINKQQRLLQKKQKAADDKLDRIDRAAKANREWFNDVFSAEKEYISVYDMNRLLNGELPGKLNEGAKGDWAEEIEGDNWVFVRAPKVVALWGAFPWSENDPRVGLIYFKGCRKTTFANIPLYRSQEVYFPFVNESGFFIKFDPSATQSQLKPYATTAKKVVETRLEVIRKLTRYQALDITLSSLPIFGSFYNVGKDIVYGEGITAETAIFLVLDASLVLSLAGSAIKASAVAAIKVGAKASSPGVKGLLKLARAARVSSTGLAAGTGSIQIYYGLSNIVEGEDTDERLKGIGQILHALIILAGVRYSNAGLRKDAIFADIRSAARHRGSVRMQQLKLRELRTIIGGGEGKAPRGVGRTFDDILSNDDVFKRWLKHKHPANQPLSPDDASKVWDKLKQLGKKPRLDQGHPGTQWDMPHINQCRRYAYSSRSRFCTEVRY